MARAAWVVRSLGQTRLHVVGTYHLPTDGPVVLVGAEEHVPYDRPPLSKAYLEAAEVPHVRFREEPDLRDGLGVELVLGKPATGLDAARTSTGRRGDSA